MTEDTTYVTRPRDGSAAGTEAAVALFDSTALQFVHCTDALIRRGRYLRGELFVAEARRHVRPGGRIVDYGCGPGRITRMLAECGYAAHGVDISERMLDAARCASQQIGVSATAYSLITDAWLEQARESFDCVLCSSVIEFSPDACEFLERINSLLVPEGILLLSFANRHSIWRRYAELRYGKSAPHFAIQRNIWTAGQCRAALARAGFNILSAPRYFESGFDQKSSLRWLSSLQFIGTLGLISAKKH